MCLELHDVALQAESTVIRPKAVRASQHLRNGAASPLLSGSLQPTTPGRTVVASLDQAAPGAGAGTGTVCGNCGTSSTPLWRKDRASGEVCQPSWLLTPRLWLHLMLMSCLPKGMSDANSLALAPLELKYAASLPACCLLQSKLACVR